MAKNDKIVKKKKPSYPNVERALEIDRRKKENIEKVRQLNPNRNTNSTVTVQGPVPLNRVAHFNLATNAINELRTYRKNTTSAEEEESTERNNLLRSFGQPSDPTEGDDKTTNPKNSVEENARNAAEGGRRRNNPAKIGKGRVFEGLEVREEKLKGLLLERTSANDALKAAQQDTEHLDYDNNVEKALQNAKKARSRVHDHQHATTRDVERRSTGTPENTETENTDKRTQDQWGPAANPVVKTPKKPVFVPGQKFPIVTPEGTVKNSSIIHANSIVPASAIEQNLIPLFKPNNPKTEN